MSSVTKFGCQAEIPGSNMSASFCESKVDDPSKLCNLCHKSALWDLLPS